MLTKKTIAQSQFEDKKKLAEFIDVNQSIIPLEMLHIYVF